MFRADAPASAVAPIESVNPQLLQQRGSARADFSGTLGFPTGTDVFDLPPGYTVNAGDYLVNNRFVSGPAAVSLPSTLALLVAGAVALVVARRRR